MKQRLLIVPAFVLAAAFVAVGCGSDSSTSALTKAEFVEQANAICSKGKEARLAADERATKQQPAQSGAAAQEKQLEELVRGELLPITRETFEEVSELGIPQGDEKAVEQILSSFDKGMKELDENPAKSFSENVFIGANERAQAYGLSACQI